MGGSWEKESSVFRFERDENKTNSSVFDPTFTTTNRIPHESVEKAQYKAFSDLNGTH